MPEFYCAKFNTRMSSLPVRLVAWQEQISCRFAHHVITVTEAWRQTLIQRGLEPAKCSVVMNLADTRYFQSYSASLASTPFRQAQDRSESVQDELWNAVESKNVVNPSEELRLIYHGNVTRRYGLDLVLQALARIRASIPGVRLTIQGRGDYLETVGALIHSLGLEPMVNLRHEFLTAAELAKLIASHQIGVVPYRRDIFTDGILPTKLMEYMALGLAVIAARTPAITTYCDKSMVELFAPEDVDDLAQRIVYLYQHPERRRELARNTRRFNQKYNWASQRENYAALVEKLGYAKQVQLRDRNEFVN